MSDHAIVLFDPSVPETPRWRDGTHWQCGSWDTLAGVLAARPWTLLLDGRHTTLIETSLPANDVATARRAAPFAIEEQLAQAVEQTRVALTARGAQRYGLVACAATLLDELARRLAALTLRPVLVTAEPYAVPWQEHTIGIAVDGADALLRCGPSQGFKVRIGDLGVLIRSLREQYPETAAVDIHGDATALPLEAFSGLDIRHHPPLDAARMASALLVPTPPALLDASSSAGLQRRARRLWALTAAAALVALVAYPALLALGNAHLEQTRSALAANNLATFSATFPEVTRVVNPRVQAEQAISNLRARSVRGPAFLDLLGDLDQAHERHLAAAVRVRSIAFGGKVLEVTLQTTDMNALEQVRGAFAGTRLHADMLSAESVDDGVLARLRLGELP